MKLLAKYNRANITATVIILLISGFCYYFILHYILLRQLDKDLHVEEQEITDYIKANNSLPKAASYRDQKVEFESGHSPVKRKISSKDVFSSTENEKVTIRQLVFPITIGAEQYNVSISKSQEETEDLIQLIVTVTLAIVLLLLFALFIINRFVLNKLWLPFNHTLSELNQFNLSSGKSLHLDNSTINEFNELNSAVTEMSNQVVKDYDSLKSFTENASHEIQTPLAIINSKLELLVQSENFTELQMEDIQTIHDEISRLSKLNQSLLLLTKIDNQQFQETTRVDLTRIINKHLAKYEELISAKNIILNNRIRNSLTVVMNESLGEILVANLITNAIKHNIEKGSIDITLYDNQLIIANTGPALRSNPDELFERFKKDKVNSESLGLGLSIVKKIAERYHFIVNYTFANELHTLIIRFP